MDNLSLFYGYKLNTLTALSSIFRSKFSGCTEYVVPPLIKRRRKFKTSKELIKINQEGKR